MENNIITSEEALIDFALKLGFLPFFKNSIKGFSVAENCPPGLWFTDVPGPWEWKGPVIRSGRCAYGKFFKNKAVYVSLDMLPHLCNYRRDGYDFDARCDDELVFYRDKEIYEIIQKHGVIVSKQLRKLSGDDKSFDKYITRLQMQTYVTVKDFVYEQSKDGKPYGWGVAVYTTPEYLYGAELITSQYKTPPDDCRKIIVEKIRSHFPESDEKAILKLIK
jgi:hypothetical protein